MKKQFSLLTLLLLFTIGIGQMWAADEVVIIGSKGSGAFSVSGTTHGVAGYSGGSNSGTITPASDSQAASAGSKMGSTDKKGSGLASKNHIRFTVAAGETVRFYYYQTGGSNKSSTFATSDYSQSSAYYHAATAYNAAAKNTLYFVDFVFADAGTYAISLTTGQSVYMAALKFTASSTKHTVTYKPGAGSGTDVVDTDAKTVAGCPTQFSYTGYDFAGWKDADNNDVEVGANVTKDMTLTAQWTVHVDKYTVKYMDGTTVLGTEQVNVSSNPAGLAENPKKDCYTFAAWDPALSTVSGTKDQVIEVSATWTPVYSSSATLISDAVVSGKPNVNTVFAASKIVSSITFTSSNYEFTSNETKKGYYGYKDKASGDYMKILVQQGKRVQVLFGNLGADPTIKINGANGALDAARLTGDNAENTFTYNASSADALISITMGSGTNTLKSVTIEDIPALSDDATLSNLTLKYGTEEPATISGFASSKQIYNVEVPYGTAKANLPIVGATATDATNALVTIHQAKDREDWKTVIRVQAEDRIDDHDKYYEVRFEVQPKLGVKLINVEVPAGTHDDTDATGYFGGTGDTKNEGNSLKIGDNCYAGVVLPNGKTFQAGDVIDIHTSVVSTSGGSVIKIYADKSASTLLYNTETIGGSTAGHNYFVLPEAVNNQSSLYVVRTSDNKWNGSIDYIAVYREMESFFESFTVAGVDATIDETVSPKTITVEVPYVTDITALTPTYKAWANGGATVSPTTAQDFSAGAVDYTVTSAYEETTTYKVTVTKAAAIKEVVISGTLSVKEEETTALSAVVYDTNDQEAAIQDVTWSVKAGDENLASVDANGVVTGKAIGTAHIIATSVADNTKSAQVEVEVSENPCRTWTNPTEIDEVRTVGKMKVTPTNLETLQTNMVPYQGATACNAWKLNAKDSRYVEVNFTDNAQFEGLTLGVSSKDSNKNYQFAVVCSSKSGANFADGILSAATYEAVDNDEPEALVDVELPEGTKAVRVYRQVVVASTTYGGGSSVFLYYINACKKELVPVTAVAVADAKLAIGNSLTMSATTTPANADIASFVWSIESMTATNVTILGNVLTAANNATEGEVIVKVVATDVLNNVVEATATIHIVNKIEVVKPVTGTTTWDWEPVSVLENGPTIAAPDTVLANYISGEIWEMLAGGNGDRPYRDNNKYKCYQGKTLYFETTVPGKLKMYAGRISNNQKVYVNGIEVGEVTSTKGYLNEIVVPAGPVYITAGTNGMRIYNMIFDATPDHERDVVVGNMGTVCLPNPSRAFGVKVYKLAGKGEGCKVQFDELGENEVLAAGKAYVLVMTDTKAKFFYTNTESPVTEADWTTAMKGNLNEETILFEPYAEAAKNVVFFKDNAMWNAYETGLKIKQYRAYLQYDEVTAPTSGPANGRRRVTLNLHQTEVATGFENLNASEKPVKLMIDGQIYILRGEKLYDATGRLVK